MSTFKTCDVCKISIDHYHNHIMMVNIGGDIGTKDICAKCWFDSKKWEQIHAKVEGRREK